MECTKKRRREAGDCHQMATVGTNSCKHHSGVRYEQHRAMGAARVDAWNAIGEGAATIDPSMVVLGVLQMTWLRLAAYGQLLKSQVTRDVEQQREVLLAQDPDDPTLFGDLAGGEAEDGREGDAGPVTEVQVAPGTAGLIGYTMGAAGKDGFLYRQSEQVRALVMLEAAERDRAVKYAKTAHDMGISSRITALAERWGDVVAGRISEMLSELQLTEEQQQLVPELIAKHLASIDMAADEMSGAPK